VNVSTTVAPNRPIGDPGARLDPAAGLAAAFDDEARLLGQLGDVLRLQRTGVARDDLGQVERSVYDAQRVLVTLSEARRRRLSLLGLLVGARDAHLDELDQVLGPAMPERLRSARDGLRRVARGLAAELVVNRRVLESAVKTGDHLIRALGGEPARTVLCGPEAGRNGSAAGGGSLISRRI
jgi:hypothetical protein